MKLEPVILQAESTIVGLSFRIVSLKSKRFSFGRAEKLCFWLIIHVFSRFRELAISRIRNIAEILFFIA